MAYQLKWPPDLSRPLTVAEIIEFRKQLKERSLNDQEYAWKAIKAAFPNLRKQCDVELARIAKRVERIRKEAPSKVWFDDVRSLPPNRGGQWPPGGYTHTGMKAAEGEKTLQPPQMILADGHSYDDFLFDFHVRQKPLERPAFSDGYHGSTVPIYELHPVERKFVRHNDDYAAHCEQIARDPALRPVLI